MLTLLDTVKILHIEPTDVCQAECPSCAREMDKTFDKNIRRYLTVNEIRDIIGDDTVSKLDKMFMCGNYGDPAASNALEIFDYFKSINPNITLGMNTNGGLQSIKWWESLAKILNNDEDYVVFSIDGLEDTNGIYRKNVNWNYVMRNAQAFIDAGGNAHWDMLIFEHNEHQIDDCELLAKNMGFKWFRTKVSRRTNVSWINPPKHWKKEHITEGTINCIRDSEQSLYLSAKGMLHPCCWLGNNFNEVTLDNFDIVRSSWNTDSCNTTCKTVCTEKNGSNNFNNQWQRTIKLC